LDPAGNVELAKYSRALDDASRQSHKPADGYLVAGYTANMGPAVFDYLVVKMDLSGNIVWYKNTAAPARITPMLPPRRMMVIIPLVAGYTNSFAPTTRLDSELNSADGSVVCREHTAAPVGTTRAISQTSTAIIISRFPILFLGMIIGC